MADSSTNTSQGAPIRVLTALGTASADQQVITLADSAGNLLGTSTAGLPIAGSQTAISTASWTSATALNTALSISVVGMNTVSVSVIPTSTFTAGVLTFEVSPDNSNWIPIAMARVDSYTVETTYTIVASTNRGWSTSVDGFTNFRVRLSTQITGTGTAVVGIIAQAMPLEPIAVVGQSVPASMQVLDNGNRVDTPAAVSASAGNATPLTIDASGHLWVKQAQPKRQQVTSSGLTTATTAYSAGDQVGAIFTFTNMAFVSGGGGYIESILLNDETGIIGTYTAWIFRNTVTLASDNAAFNLAADADAEAMVGIPITIGPVYTTAANFQGGWVGSLPYDCAATSLFIALQTNAGHTFFGAATALKLTVTAAILG